MTKPYRDPHLPSPLDEWTHTQNSNGDHVLTRNGRVVYVARTEEELQNWWDAKQKTAVEKFVHPNSLGRAIRRMG